MQRRGIHQAASFMRQRLSYKYLQHNSSIISRVNARRASYNQSTPLIQPSPGTYFQPPPTQKPKLRWRVLRGTVYCMLAFAAGWYSSIILLAQALDKMPYNMDDSEDLDPQGTVERLGLYLQKHSAHGEEIGDPFDRHIVQTTTDITSPSVITHTAQALSNFPCEDYFFMRSLTVDNAEPLFCMFGTLDGHAGHLAAEAVADALPDTMMRELAKRHYTADTTSPISDQTVEQIMESVFTAVDQELISALPQIHSSGTFNLKTKMTVAIRADAGSCALLSLYDPVASRLHVANLGDSRAVLGRWDASLGRYIAIPLSQDHTGFNQSEKDRLAREHPGEKCIDEKTGRLFGLAVTRAFGDARWKWPAGFMEAAHRNFFTTPPRPDGAIKTPPYLTAVPEISHTDIQAHHEHPDFLISATDGLWDQLSSEAAVELVQLWLDKFTPAEHVVNRVKRMEQRPRDDMSQLKQIDLYRGNMDLYYDTKDKAIKWKNDKSHWVVERPQCGQHLIQNALGGDRKELFSALMSIPPSHSRNVRDDITVTVVFFGADTSQLPPEAMYNGIVN